MVLTAPFYDVYNSRYRKIEMIIRKYIFGEYPKNQKRYDRGLFSKTDHHDMTRQELPRTQKEGPRTTFSYFSMLMLMVFTATSYDAYN